MCVTVLGCDHVRRVLRSISRTILFSMYVFLFLLHLNRLNSNLP